MSNHTTADRHPGDEGEAGHLPWAGQAYSVKRFGVTITNCDSEPVQTPGCIQGHGALLVLNRSDLCVAQASENSDALLGRAVAALLGQPVSLVLGAQEEASLRRLLGRDDCERNPRYLCTLPAHDSVPALDVSVHTVDGVVVVEFEATGRSQPRPDPASWDPIGRVQHSVARLQKADTLQALGDIATAEIRSLTGLDRVMVYRFHADGHGEIVAENRRDDLAPWLGMHYPAQDIPEPAREIFRQSWIRPLREVGAPLAELVPLAHPDTGRPLTMTHCALRGPSLMHTEYLQNMGVTAGLTLAIRRGDQLWGLITGHHYSGAHDMSFEMRAACELLAVVVSLQHRAAQEREELVYRLQLDNVLQQLVTQAAHEGGLSALLDGPPTLLDAMSAGGAALLHRDRWTRAGAVPPEAELQALGAWLANRPELIDVERPIFVTDALAREYPPAAAWAGCGGGLMAIALSRTLGDMVLWFRPEALQSVRWSGNPDDKPRVLGPHGMRLTPRRSFELFVDSVRGRSLPWKSVEVDAALRFRAVLMELVVSRAAQLASLNADLARSNDDLDAFAYVASHDLKEPLRGIYKYAHQMATDAAERNDPDRERLAGLLRLALRMDSLLDSLLHFSRVGRVALLLEPVDVNEVVAEAIEMVDGRRRDKPAEIVVPVRLPVVQADRVRLREVFVNLLSNALKYNDRPITQVEIGCTVAGPQAPAGDGSPPGVTFFVRDNGIGIQPRHVDQVFKMFKRLHGRDEFGGGTGAGLTIVRKLVERHGGDVWFESTFGQGSTFFFTIPGVPAAKSNAA